MGYDATWFKEYDDLYFEIWQRVTKKSVSHVHCTPVFCLTKQLFIGDSLFLQTLCLPAHDFWIEY
jgi:hypothetical protein